MKKRIMAIVLLIIGFAFNMQGVLNEKVQRSEQLLEAAIDFQADGEYDNAQNAFEEAWDINPGNTTGVQLIEFYDQMAEWALQADTYDKDMHDLYSKLSAKTKIKLYKFNDNGPMLVAAYKNLGDVYYAQEDFINAKRYYAKALELKNKLEAIREIFRKRLAAENAS